MCSHDEASGLICDLLVFLTASSGPDDHRSVRQGPFIPVKGDPLSFLVSIAEHIHNRYCPRVSIKSVSMVTSQRTLIFDAAVCSVSCMLSLCPGKVPNASHRLYLIYHPTEDPSPYCQVLLKPTAQQGYWRLLLSRKSPPD